MEKKKMMSIEELEAMDDLESDVSERATKMGYIDGDSAENEQILASSMDDWENPNQVTVVELDK